MMMQNMMQQGGMNNMNMINNNINMMNNNMNQMNIMNNMNNNFMSNQYNQQQYKKNDPFADLTLNSLSKKPQNNNSNNNPFNFV